MSKYSLIMYSLNIYYSDHSLFHWLTWWYLPLLFYSTYNVNVSVSWLFYSINAKWEILFYSATSFSTWVYLDSGRSGFSSWVCHQLPGAWSGGLLEFSWVGGVFLGLLTLDACFSHIRSCKPSWVRCLVSTFLAATADSTPAAHSPLHSHSDDIPMPLTAIHANISIFNNVLSANAMSYKIY